MVTTILTKISGLMQGLHWFNPQKFQQWWSRLSEVFVKNRKSTRKIEYRILIKDFIKIGYTAAEIHRAMKQMLGIDVPSLQTLENNDLFEQNSKS